VLSQLYPYSGRNVFSGQRRSVHVAAMMSRLSSTLPGMTDNTRWIWFAIFGAFFAAVTQVVGKPASDRLGPNVVSLTRALVMTLLFIAVVFYESRNPGATGGGATVDGSAQKPATGNETRLTPPFLWTLAISGGVAASLSWFFGYKALRLAGVSKTYPIDKLSVAMAVVLAVIFLGERPSLTNWSGIGLMVVGAYLVTMKSA
jgi:bacterial/archaeal transporter family protein